MEFKEGSDSQNIDHIKHLPEERVGDSIFGNKYLKWLPTKQRVFTLISHLFIICFVVAIFYSVLDNAVLPGSEIFALFFVYVSAYIGGKIMKFVRLPPLLGMLIAGFLFRNLPFIPYYKDISVRWLSTLRNSAFVVILLKASLGLDAEQLKKLKTVVLQLAFLPCIFETITLGIASHFLLDFPWMWSIMFGFVIAAVSPAVVVPSLLSLQEREYGTLKGVPTLMIAASSLDNILAITGFPILLHISLSEGNWIWSLVKGILGPVAGFMFGISVGCILWYIPGKEISKTSLGTYRIVLLCCAGLAVRFTSKLLDVAGAGPSGCLVLGFVAAFRWKTDSEIFTVIKDSISLLWKLLEPFLFSLIGCEVTVASLQKDICSSIAALAVGCAFRILTALVVTFGGGLNVKEKIFIAVAWLPKATVQAAAGPQALDYVLANDKGPEMEGYAKKVLSVAVLSILLTAPLGAALITLLGPVLLSHDRQEVETEDTTKMEEANSHL